MQVNIIIFGQLTDITGNSLSLDGINDTNDLINVLIERYPELAEKKYAIAVDKQVITKNTILNSKSIVALLPPFSGG